MSERDDICYHHFSLTFEPRKIAAKFKDVRFVLVAGCARRAEAHANYLVERLFNRPSRSDDNNSIAIKGGQPAGVSLERLTCESSRFALFKVGPVLLANHGMGPASMSIALHELFLMCQQAQVIDRITLIRFGTCGGIGVAPGTVCITNRAFDPLFQEFIELKVCLKTVRRSTEADQRVAQELADCAKGQPATAAAAAQDDGPPAGGGQLFEVKMGATIGTSDFYEEQGRTNGAICEHSQADKRRFLERANEMGVINMEMESNHLAAMCNKLKVPFGVVCVALNNRLKDDRVLLTREQMAQFEERLFWIITRFVGKRLAAAQ